MVMPLCFRVVYNSHYTYIYIHDVCQFVYIIIEGQFVTIINVTYSQIMQYALELVGNLGLTSILKIGY